MNCMVHTKCNPGTEVWRAAMAKALVVDREEMDEDDEDAFEEMNERLDEAQFCPLCVIELDDRARANPSSVLKVQLEAAENELRRLRATSEKNASVVAAVVGFIKEATGKDACEMASQRHKGGQGDLANIIPNLLHEAVLKRVQDGMERCRDRERADILRGHG